MNINDLQAGPELDRIIAERVMGWRVNHVNAAGVCTLGRYEEFSPSTNIAHAWEVVSDFSVRGFVVRISADKYGAICRIVRGDHGDEVSSDVAGSAPIAICRAALKAMAER